MTKRKLMAVYRRLLGAFGPRNWWPAETRFEVMVGAVLTQNMAWSNVEKAISGLKSADALDPHKLFSLRVDRLARLIRPSGYYNIKARRLKSLVKWLCRKCNGSLAALSREPTEALRKELLGINGVGEETADSILLYALDRPVFVVDAYTRRVLSRHGLVREKASYAEIQGVFHDQLPPDVALYNEYHALLVALGNRVCRPKPLCDLCPVQECLGPLRRDQL